MELDPVDQILTQWQRERPDLDVSPMGIIGRMTRLSKHLERGIQQTFKKFGLTAAEFDVLATLRRSGSPYTLSPTDLYNMMMVSSGTMTHRVDLLQQAELIQRIPDPCDRRGTLIVLTKKGFDLIEQAVTAHVSHEHQMLSALESSERDTLILLLRKLLVSFEQ